MDYVAKHARALEKLEEAGVAVSFRVSTPGEYNELTDEIGEPTITSVDGRAVEIPADPEEYEARNLILSQTITLFFVPTVMGELPDQHSTVAWAGSLRTVSALIPIRPAEVVIAAKVMVT